MMAARPPLPPPKHTAINMFSFLFFFEQNMPEAMKKVWNCDYIGGGREGETICQGRNRKVTASEGREREREREGGRRMGRMEGGKKEGRKEGDKCRCGEAQ